MFVDQLICVYSRVCLMCLCMWLQAVNMLNKILRMRIKFLGHEHIATGEVMFTVGLVHLYLEQHDKAQKNIEGAKNIYSNSLVGASQGGG